MNLDRIDAATVERLREMYDVARHVNGGTPTDHPSRRVSVAFTAELARLVEQGVTEYRIAKQLGVTLGAIKFRLARHRYRPSPPSQADYVYIGRQTDPAPPKAMRLDVCKKADHPLAGDNVYVTPSTGSRACRTCKRDYSRRWYERRKAEGGAS